MSLMYSGDLSLLPVVLHPDVHCCPGGSGGGHISVCAVTGGESAQGSKLSHDCHVNLFSFR